MARNSVELPAPPAQVFEALLDPNVYPRWVVGAQNVRGADADWPKPGSAFYHESGPGGSVRDHTRVVDIHAPNKLVLQAYARPFGVVRITFKLRDQKNGATRLDLTEVPAPGTRLRRVKGVLDPLIYLRNKRALSHLRAVIETYERGASDETGTPTVGKPDGRPA